MAKSKKLLITEYHLTSFANDKNEFLDRFGVEDDDHVFITRTSEHIYRSIAKQAALTQNNQPLKIALQEFICNAIDSFADIFTNKGQSLVITLVIREINDQLQITLKDNGKGFSGKPKQQKFSFAEINPTKKQQNHLGGMGKGCEVSNKMLVKQGFTLFAKNRKSSGAAIILDTPYSTPKANR